MEPNLQKLQSKVENQSHGLKTLQSSRDSWKNYAQNIEYQLQQAKANKGGGRNWGNQSWSTSSWQTGNGGKNGGKGKGGKSGGKKGKGKGKGNKSWKNKY